MSFKRQERTAAIFLDFTKTFNKMWHQGLLVKMIDMNKKFWFRANDFISETRSIAAGLLQGSCLSPQLFTIYINDMPSRLYTKINLFADDTMFFHTSVGKHHAARKLQE